MIRLVGAELADMHEEWQAGDCRHLSEGSTAQRYHESGTDLIAEPDRRLTPRVNLGPHHSAGRCHQKMLKFIYSSDDDSDAPVSLTDLE